MSQYIKSIQKVSIALVNVASNTATISAVNTSNTIIIPDSLTSNTSSSNIYWASTDRITLTNSTTVTVNRDVNATTNTNTVKCTVVEFNSDVNSVQSGLITITAGNTSNTATISAVGANAFIIWLGNETTGGAGGFTDSWATSVVLTNATTVTAGLGVSIAADIKVAFMVADLSSNIIKSVQAISKADSSSATSYTTTITSVTAGNSLIFPNGSTAGTSTLAATNLLHRMAITGATTVTWTRSGSGTVSRTVFASVVEFQPGALNGSVQAGTISGDGATNAIAASISSIDTTMSFVVWGGQITGALVSTAIMSLTLTNGTTVTANTSSTSSTTATVGYQVIQFSNTAPASGWGRRLSDARNRLVV